MDKERIDFLVNQMVGVSGWIVSCKTKVQVKVVMDFFEKINQECYGSRDVKLIYNLGITTGVMQLHVHNLKKEQEKLASVNN